MNGVKMRLEDRRSAILAESPAYKYIERLLWTTAPPVILLLVLSNFTMETARQQAEENLAKEIAAESAEYCERWGMPVGGPSHAACVRDLGSIRSRAEQRVRNEERPGF